MGGGNFAEATLTVDGVLDVCSKAWNGDLHIYLRDMLVEQGGEGPKHQARR
jgi:hypothetical protein